LGTSDALTNETEFLGFQVDALTSAEYCDSPGKGERRCVLEYGSLKHKIQRECELADGTYLEAFYTSQCRLNTSVLIYAAFDEPHCIGTLCDDDEGVKLVENQIIGSIHARFEQGGYECAISYIRVMQFARIWRRATDAPMQNPTSTIAPTPSPVASQPTKSVPPLISSPPPEKPTTSSPVQFTSNPAISAQNEGVFGPQVSNSSEGLDELKQGWMIVIILLISTLAVAVAYPLWKRLMQGSKTTTHSA
jgi:hypothetical protein